MEATILLALQSLRFPVLTQLAALISALGNYGFVWIVLGIVFIVFLGRNDVGVTLLFTVVFTGIIVGFILQPIFAHVRPYDAGIGVSAVMGVSRTGLFVPKLSRGDVLRGGNGHRDACRASLGDLGLRRGRFHRIVSHIPRCRVASRHPRRRSCRCSRWRCLSLGLQSVPARPHSRLPRYEPRQGATQVRQRKPCGSPQEIASQ